MKVRKLGTKKWEDYEDETETDAVELYAYDNELEPCVIETEKGNLFEIDASIEYIVQGITLLPK